MAKQKKMDIIYEDKELLVVNKPSGLLTIATDKNESKTLYHQAREYVKKQNPRNKIFIVHRLDKDTSGLVIFAKNEKLKLAWQKDWEKYAVGREYIAIVEGKLTPKEGTIKSYLKETKTFYVYSSHDKKGKLAITNYAVLASNKDYSLVKINILTGRKNQIRVHMNDVGHPIVGDKKYGSTKKNYRELFLHANRLEIIHPFTNKKMIFETPMPSRFKKVLDRYFEDKK